MRGVSSEKEAGAWSHRPYGPEARLWKPLEHFQQASDII